MAKKKHTNKTYLNASGRVAVIVSDFNEEIGQGLLEGLEAEFEKCEGVKWQVHQVPGAFEVPLYAQKLAQMVQVHENDQEEKLFDVIVVLGAVIKGDTYHFELVANECARGCMDVGLTYDIPIVFEILACYTEEDAVKRSQGEGNKGKAAALVALDWLDKLK